MGIDTYKLTSMDEPSDEVLSQLMREAAIADRVYIYDNSVDDAEARLLFRMTDGRPFKRYTDDIPEWALTILNF